MNKTKRREKLKKNSSKLFWIQALLNVKMINIVMSLFLVHRGLDVSHIFYLAIIWAATNIITEIPSSYLADKIGRKKTILLGTVASMFYWIFFFVADSFLLFAVGTMWYSFSYAMISGTDQALLYDSEKELGKTDKSLQTLGTYAAASRIFKIFATIIAVLIAKNLTEVQFQILITVDIIVTIIATGVATTLIEAHHKIDVEDIESGIIIDAYNLLKRNALLTKAILSNVLIIIGALIIYHYYQVFFTELGLPIIVLGVGFALHHLAGAIFSHYGVRYISKQQVTQVINILNITNVSLLMIFLITWLLFPNPYLLYTIYLTYIVSQVMRIPLYNELFNTLSKSYNRATTISLTNFVKNVLDIPVLLIAGLIIKIDLIAPYVFSLILGLITITFFRLYTKKQ